MNSPGEELLDFMVANAIYPFCSKKGKVFLRCSKKGILTEGTKKEIIEQLNIETGDECETLREKLKTGSRASYNSSIKEWIKKKGREKCWRGWERKICRYPSSAIIENRENGSSAEELGQTLLNHFGSLRAIDAAPFLNYLKLKGLVPLKQLKSKHAELGKRLFRKEPQPGKN